MADRYWVGGAGSWSFSSTSNWAAISGGASGASAPTSADNAIFDANSGTGTVTLDSSPICNNWNFTAATTNIKFYNNSFLTVHGNITLNANATLAVGGTPLTIEMRGTGTGRTSAIPNTSLVSSITYYEGGISQSAATFSVSAWVYGATVTFTGAITTPDMSVYSGSLTTGAFTHVLANAVDQTFTLFVDAGATGVLTNSTFNVGTILGAFLVFPSVEFVAGSTITAANTRFDLGVNSSTVTNYSTFRAESGGTFGTLNMYYPYDSSIYGVNSFTTLSCTNGWDGGLKLYNNQTCTGTFTLSGASVSNRFNVLSDTTGTQRTITLSSATAAAKNITNTNFADIQITNTGSAIVSSSIGDCLGNTMTILTPAVTRYAVTKLAGVAITGVAGQFSCTATTGLAINQQVAISGTLTGTGTITGYVAPGPLAYYIIATNGTTTFQLSDSYGGLAITTTAGTTVGLTFSAERTCTSTNMWSAASGGASGATMPLPQDTVIFDANTGSGYVSVGGNSILGKDINLTGFTGTLNATNVAIYGTLTSPSFFFVSNAALFATRTSGTFTVPSTFSMLEFSNFGATITLAGAVTSSYGINLIAGTFATNNYNISASYFISSTAPSNVTNACTGYSTGNTLTLGSSVVTLSNSGGSAISTNVGTTVNAGTSKIVLTGQTTTVNLNNIGSFYNLEFAYTGVGSTSTATLTGPSLTFNSLLNSNTKPTKVTVEASRTLTAATFALAGAIGNTIALIPSTATGTYTLAIANNATTNYVVYRGVNKSGAGILNARGVADLGNNTGILFTSTVKAVVYTGSVGTTSTGSFTVPSDFLSNGSSMLIAVGGGGGAARRTSTSGSGGGGGGSMGIVSNLNVTAGQTVYFQTGRGGVGTVAPTSASGTAGAVSWINVSSNATPTTIASGTTGNGGGASIATSSSGGAAGAVSTVALFTYAGGGGGGGGLTPVAGGGGGSAPSLKYGTGNAGGTTSGVASSGGSGGGGQFGAGVFTSTTTGGAGGPNLLNASAAGGPANNVGTAGTLGGGGGGGGGALAATTGGNGGAAQSNNEFNYTVLNGVAGTGAIGTSGGGGGGGATVTGIGGSGGSAAYGGGGGGAGKSSTTANAGNGGDGGPGIVLFLYEAASAGGSQAIFIG